MFASAAMARMVAASYPDSANLSRAAVRIAALVWSAFVPMPTTVGQHMLTFLQAGRIMEMPTHVGKTLNKEFDHECHRRPHRGSRADRPHARRSTAGPGRSRHDRGRSG